MCIIVNLSMTPAMLLTFEKFFERATQESTFMNWICGRPSRRNIIKAPSAMSIQDGNDSDEDDALIGVSVVLRAHFFGVGVGVGIGGLRCVCGWGGES